MCALIGQKPKFNQSIKHGKSVFCFSPHNQYIVKQMKKPKPCITLWLITPDILWLFPFLMLVQ